MEENSQALNLDDYCFIIECIYNKYKEYCSHWNGIKKQSLNLKSKLICDIYNPTCGVDRDFLEYMYTFKDGLMKFYTGIMIELDNAISITQKTEFTGRVKTEDSIRNKIFMKAHDKNGKFPINKCLNDLLGLRIIDQNYKNNISMLENEIFRFKNQGFSINNIYRDTVEGYKGYHIYFKDSNQSFPIELQIWDSVDKEKNRELHVPYKQNYIKDLIEDYNKF